MQRNGYKQILDDPSHIYNCDETGFPMAPKPGKVIAGKGEVHVYQTGTSSSKNQITTLLASSAAGHFILPVIVYPRVQPRMQLRDEVHVTLPWGVFGNSASSWMDSDLFVSWLENGFLKGIKERGLTLPVLLLINGVKSHLSIHTSEFCNKNIILYVLYPNATHLIQPMDLVLMNSIKTVYKEEVRIWLQKNPGVLFDKYLFIQVFAVVWEWVACKEKSIIGFEKSEIFPWNPQKIKDGKLAQVSIYECPDPLPEINDSVNEPVNVAVIEPQEGDIPVQVSG